MIKSRILDVLLYEKRMHLKSGLYQRTQIDFAFNSNGIAGNTLSEDRVCHVFDANYMLEGKKDTLRLDDILESINHFVCFDYMLDHADESLTEEMIKEFQRLLVADTSVSKRHWFRTGEYKPQMDETGRYNSILPAKIDWEMQKLLDEYNCIQNVGLEEITRFHQRFEFIHPFQDANGRVGRIIMFKECLKNNLMPFIIIKMQKWYYYKGLKEYGNDNEYLLEASEKAQREYEKVVDVFGTDRQRYKRMF